LTGFCKFTADTCPDGKMISLGKKNDFFKKKKFSLIHKGEFGKQKYRIGKSILRSPTHPFTIYSFIQK
jgi:hypothetical protein